MLDFINRVRNFDYRELTPTQIVLGIAALIIGLWLVAQVVNLVLGLAPIAIAGLALYFIYQWLSSRSEDLPEEATKSKAQAKVDEALANVERAEASQQSEAVQAATQASATDDTPERRLEVEQVVNPETGFKEPNIERLIEREQEKLREKIIAAKDKLPRVHLTNAAIEAAAELCVALEVDGHRGELTLCRAAVAQAAFNQQRYARPADIAQVATLALQHRLRKDPLETAGDETRVLRAVEEVIGSDE